MSEQTAEITAGGKLLVREGEEAFAWCRELIEEHGPIKCWVTLPESGERCPEVAVMEVYKKGYCEAHGAEIKAGALEELYYDAAVFFERLDNPHVPGLNSEALKVIQANIRKFYAASTEAVRLGDSALKRAFPFRPDLMDEDFRDFDYAGGGELGGADPTPEDWCRHHRLVIHRLMRLAFEDDADYALEKLEKDRQHVAVQLAYVLVDAERKWAAAKA